MSLLSRAIAAVRDEVLLRDKDCEGSISGRNVYRYGLTLALNIMQSVETEAALVSLDEAGYCTVSAPSLVDSGLWTGMN